MNRSLIQLAAMSAMYAHTAAPTSLLPNNTRHAGQLDDNYSLGLVNIDDDSSGATGGEAIKSDDVTLAKGANVGEDGEQTQQQAETASAAAPGTAIDNKVDDAGMLGGQAKIIGDPTNGQASQLG